MQRIRGVKNAVVRSYSCARSIPQLAARQIGTVLKLCNAIELNIQSFS